MIRGKFALDPQNLAVVANAIDDDGQVVATGRLCIRDDRFYIALDPAQDIAHADLVARMLLLRAQDLHAPGVYVESDAAYPAAFFAQYGFCAQSETLLYVANQDINIEGACHGCPANRAPQ